LRPTVEKPERAIFPVCCRRGASGIVNKHIGPIENIGRPRVRFAALRRALDYVEVQANIPHTVSELSQAALVSARTLEYAFREYYGVSPKTYLLALRLNSVRNELLAADLDVRTVQEVASHWDFWHMSQFARLSQAVR
jgi:transcriptional regulator GlxA family with amidase domain